MITNVELTARIKALPVDPVRGYPVPWFVAWIDGKPEFRVADASKFGRAVRERLCWVCGQRLDNRASYLIGPMCVINRVSAEPPSHPECAAFSAMACPFLSRPHMDRRENALPGDTCHAGEMIRRNPGVSCQWTGRTPGATVIPDPNGVLFRLNPPLWVQFWYEGRPAEKHEIEASVVSGLPLLRDMAESQERSEPGCGAMDALREACRDAATILGFDPADYL